MKAKKTKPRPKTPYERLKDATVAFYNAMCAARNKQNMLLLCEDATNPDMSFRLHIAHAQITAAQTLGFDVIARAETDGRITFHARKRVDTRDHWVVRLLDGTGDTQDGTL